MVATRDASRRELLVGVATAAFLVVSAYVILQPFLVPIAWAAIHAYATWPVYRRVRIALGGREGWAALVMTLLMILAVALPVTLLSIALADDVGTLFRTLRAWAAEPPDLPAWAAELPVVGASLVGWHATLRANPGAVQRLLVERVSWVSQTVLTAAGDIGRNLARLGLTLVTVFFLYRHGEVVLAQTRRVIDRLAGEGFHHLLGIVGATVRAVFYGVLLTAATQGLLAGVGFWVAGVRGAVLLGALTAVLALIPFGPPLVWLPVALWMLATVSVWKGIALLVWGAVVVSGSDNVLRPYFIGGATQVPFLFVLFGVLGGLTAFGLLGLFIGPVVLAVLLVLWREWAAAPPPAGAGSPSP